MNALSDVARRLLRGVSLGVVLAACQGPDAFYRDETGQAGTGITGAAGVGPTGSAGTTGAAGTLGIAGTSATGTAGTSAAAGTTGAAGTSATGAAGTTGNAGANGRGGTTGSAGSTGNGGRGGNTGAAGTNGDAGTTGTAGRGGRAGGGRGGTTGTGGTTGAAGATGAAGTGAGGATVCAQCMPQVLQKCQQDTSTNSIPLQFRVVNNGAAQIPWSDITVRYWFSHTTTSTPVMEIDDSQVIPKTAITGKFTADYIEIGFTSAAGSLYAFDLTAGSGPIQFRLHPTDYSNWNTSQLDDYSYQMCAGNTYNAWKKTTAYIKGVLAWGTEPP